MSPPTRQRPGIQAPGAGQSITTHQDLTPRVRLTEGTGEPPEWWQADEAAERIRQDAAALAIEIAETAQMKLWQL